MILRCIPSCLDTVSGEILCYTVRKLEEDGDVYEYDRMWRPIGEWIRPDGSYLDYLVATP